MKINKIEVNNFRSLKSVTVYPQEMQALVGRNNCGKSNLMKALQILFEGSVTLISDDCFFDNDTSLTIEIFVTFEGLSDWEKEQFAGYVFDDKLTVGRKITMNQGSPVIVTVGLKRKPEQDWLRNENATTETVNSWWESKDSLSVNGIAIASFLEGKRKGVAVWKEAAQQFISDHSDVIQFENVFEENPKGYANVLKGALPEFVYVPAVRDVSDEAKVGKTNPFGQLIGSIMEKITEGQAADLDTKIKQIELMLNRTGGDERIQEIKRIETRLNELICQIMPCDIEIEMSMPKIKEVVSGAKVYANDGVRTLIDAKGHGLQRSMIFAILRAYAELSHVKKAQERHEQRNTIFAIEEPELYLHPQSQRTLFNVLRSISEGTDQVIYTTHSSLFLEIAHFDEVCIFRKVDSNGKMVTKPTQLSVSQLLTDLNVRLGVTGSEEGIREQYSNVFNPMINEGFFADKVVIVEGNSELYILPIYSKLLGYDLDQNNVAVVHADGKGSIDRLLRIFNGFEIPTYTWFDGDKNNTDSNVKQDTIKLLDLLQAPIADISSLVTTIADGYAVFEETLETKLATEIGDYQSLMDGAASVIGSCGKPLKHRYVARMIEKGITEDGRTATETVPASIQSIVEKIKALSFGGTLLKTAA